MGPTKTGGETTKRSAAPGRSRHPDEAEVRAKGGDPVALDAAEFRERLMAWYGAEARELPWRGTRDPYRIWVSEIMLQQTRVASVIDRYNEFLLRFPTLLALSLATEDEVLAAWSGLGYYRRARMLHKAAQFIVLERDGRLPATAAELRTLPGIGDYTAAAIASIAFGEAVAVVDGNVERVILRLTGRADEATAAARAQVREQAQALMPGGDGAAAATAPSPARASTAEPGDAAPARLKKIWDSSERIALAASAHPTDRAGGDGTAEMAPEFAASNPAGDHNQAMMELGATVCLPRAPLCAVCPVEAMCRTRGEHATQPRGPQRSQPAAYLLDLRKSGAATEVLLELRASDAAVMPAMFELPPLPLDAVEGREPVLRLRHSITNTNYYVQVFSPQRFEPGGEKAGKRAHPLRRAAKTKSEGGAEREQHWVRTARLPGIPMTGLARKILQRLHVMESARMALLE